MDLTSEMQNRIRENIWLTHKITGITPFLSKKSILISYGSTNVKWYHNSIKY